MVRTVNLDENEHAVRMLRGLKQMKNEQDLCDFIIKVGGVEYQTHKNILSVGSPYFKAMLKHDTKESRDGKVEIKDVDPECVKSCIDFMYSGNFDVPDGKMSQLLHVANMLQLDKVKDAISEILNVSLNAENLSAISSQSGHQNNKLSDMINILKSKSQNLSEEEKLTVSLRWVGENPAEKKNIFELIKLINLMDVSSEYLSDILVNDPVIRNDFRLYKIITATYIEKTKAVKKSSHKKDSYRNQIVLFDRSANFLRSLDPVTDEVTKFHNEKFKHLRHFTAVSIDFYIYVLRWNRSVLRLNFLDKNSKWERMQGMINDHGPLPPAVSLSGSLFVIGSYEKATKVVEMFVPAAKRWLRLEDKPEATHCPTLVSMNDSIYCIGGWNGCKALKSFCRFTPSSSEWVDLAPTKNSRYMCGALAIGQKIFVMGGEREKKLNKVECYDVFSKQWSYLSRMIEPHSYCIAHHIDGWIFLVDRYENSNTVEKYNIANDRWCKVEFKKVEQFTIYQSVSIQI